MKPLSIDLQARKESLIAFCDLTERVLNHIDNVATAAKHVKEYVIFSSKIAGIKKYSRPLSKRLFSFEQSVFKDRFESFTGIIDELRKGKRDFNEEAYFIIDSVSYTMVQAAGVGLDLLVHPNSARKHVGNRFEEFIRLLITGLGIANKRIVLKIPYSTNQNKKDVYSCETDLVLSPFENVKSDTIQIDRDEVVISVKTSSKDRLGKIFLDKLLMREFVGHDVKVVGIFLNDVQRKGSENINFTFVSGLFMVYTKFLTALDGLYFIEPPPKTKESPYHDYIFPFSRFICKDIWDFLKKPV